MTVVHAAAGAHQAAGVVPDGAALVGVRQVGAVRDGVRPAMVELQQAHPPVQVVRHRPAHPLAVRHRVALQFLNLQTCSCWRWVSPVWSLAGSPRARNARNCKSSSALVRRSLILLHHGRVVIGGLDGPFLWLIVVRASQRLDARPIARANGYP